MPPVVDTVNASTKVACHSTTCYDSGCELGLNGLKPPFVLVNLEHSESPADKSVKHCDSLLFGMPNNAGTEWVIPIELTTGKNKEVEHIVEQLSGGANIADALLHQGANVNFKAVVGQDSLHRDEFNRLRQMRVPFRNRCGRIRVLSCSEELIDALS